MKTQLAKNSFLSVVYEALRKLMMKSTLKLRNPIERYVAVMCANENLHARDKNDQYQ